MIIASASIALFVMAPISGLAVNVFTQFVLVRLVRSRAHLRLQFLSFAIGFAVTAALLIWVLWRAPLSTADAIGYFLLHMMTYASLGFIFFNIINANVSSLRIRMLKEYLAHDPEPLRDSVLCARYPPSQILDVRLARLQAGRQIVLRDGRYVSMRGAVVMIGDFFEALRRLLLGH